MAGRPIRLGVAGLGRAFTLMLPTFTADSRIVLAAATDLRPEARRRFEADFGAPTYDTIEALLVPNYRWLENIAVTSTEIFAGYILAVVFGIGAALLFSWFRVLEMAVMPLLVSLNMIPKVALGPLIIVWFAYGVGPNAMMAFAICFFPIVLTTARGLHEVEPDLIDLVRTLRGSRWQISPRSSCRGRCPTSSPA